MSKIFDFTKQIYNGKTVGRILFNFEAEKYCSNLSGKIIDLAGGQNASYYKYFPKNADIVKTNLNKKSGVDIAVDLNNKLPFSDETADNILLFNAIYIVENPEMLLEEVYRVLKKGGRLFLSSPFLYNEMPEPHDYCRFTGEGFEKLFKKAGWEDIKIVRFGERFSSSANLLHPFFIFNSVRFVVYSVAILLDRLIPKKIVKNYPAPLGYFCIAKKTCPVRNSANYENIMEKNIYV